MTPDQAGERFRDWYVGRGSHIGDIHVWHAWSWRVFEAEHDAARAAFRDGGGSILWLDERTERWRRPTPDELASLDDFEAGLVEEDGVMVYRGDGN